MKRSIYLLEDDYIAAFITTKLLNNHPQCGEILTFPNGEKALDYLEEVAIPNNEYPYLIFLDLNMPLVDGWEFLDRLSIMECAKTLPVVIMTSSINPEDADRAKKYSSVHSFISKPLNSQLIENLFNDILEKQN